MTNRRKIGKRLVPQGIIEKDGTVCIRIYHVGREIFRRIGPIDAPGIIDEAITKLNDFRRQIRSGRFGIEEEATRATIEQAIETFWTYHAQHARGSYTFRYILEHVKQFFAGRYLDSITPIDIQKYRAHRLQSVGLSTFNRERTVLVSLFNKLRELREEKEIKNIRLPEGNPASKVKRENEKIYARRRVLAPEEFERFMQTASLNVRRNCLGAVHTLLRLKDLKALSRANENRATNQLDGVQAKTGKAYAIPINGVVRQLLDTATGERVFDFTNFRKEFEAAKIRSGVSFQFRDLRRTGARAMLRKGADIATVSSYLGHASIAMTQTYVPPSRDDKQVAAELLGSSYKPPLTTDQANIGASGGENGGGSNEAGNNAEKENAKI